MSGKIIQAAGAVILAGPPYALRVAVLHRCTPPEWRLPKGKLRPEESATQAAEREVCEETGLEVTVTTEVGRSQYDYCNELGGAMRKTVRFYRVYLPRPLPLRPELGTFDKARWMELEEALENLTWPNEREMVRIAAGKI